MTALIVCIVVLWVVSGATAGLLMWHLATEEHDTESGHELAGFTFLGVLAGPAFWLCTAQLILDDDS